MKWYTTLEQSRKLADILPINSANMCWGIDDDVMRYSDKPYLNPYKNYTEKKYYIPCWSLAALLGFLDRTAYFIDENASVSLSSYKTIKWTVSINNSDLELITEADPIDACVKMILKLHELNLL